MMKPACPIRDFPVLRPPLFPFKFYHFFPPPHPLIHFLYLPRLGPLLSICVRIFALGVCEKPNISGEIVFFSFFPSEELMDHFVLLTGLVGIVYVLSPPPPHLGG